MEYKNKAPPSCFSLLECFRSAQKPIKQSAPSFFFLWNPTHVLRTFLSLGVLVSEWHLGSRLPQIPISFKEGATNKEFPRPLKNLKQPRTTMVLLVSSANLTCQKSDPANSYEALWKMKGPTDKWVRGPKDSLFERLSSRFNSCIVGSVRTLRWHHTVQFPHRYTQKNVHSPCFSWLVGLCS